MPEAIEQKSAEHDRVYESYRRWGYLAADLDPFGFLAPVEHPELIRDGPAAAAARKLYCGTIGAEFVHIDDPERRRWIADRMESDPPQPDRAYILERLIRADLFEQVGANQPLQDIGAVGLRRVRFHSIGNPAAALGIE